MILPYTKGNFYLFTLFNNTDLPFYRTLVSMKKIRHTKSTKPSICYANQCETKFHIISPHYPWSFRNLCPTQGIGKKSFFFFFFYLAVIVHKQFEFAQRASSQCQNIYLFYNKPPCVLTVISGVVWVTSSMLTLGWSLIVTLRMFPIFINIWSFYQTLLTNVCFKTKLPNQSLFIFKKFYLNSV